jgi:hypothetical protein
MPPRPPDREGLPEPADLHAEFSQVHRLDWGEPIATASQIAAEFGAEATAQSLELIRRLTKHHRHATQQLLDSIQPGDKTHGLDHRIKSPASLARKIWKYRSIKLPPPLDDVLRFTVVAGSPETLVKSARETVSRLGLNGWQVESAHQSYVDGSRYKGIHTIMRTSDRAQAEVQFHSPESIRVKMQTTSLYHLARDPRQSRATRDAAGAEAVRLSAAMAQPPGIEGLTHLGGVSVEARRYGSSIRQRKPRPAQESQPDGRANSGPVRQRDVENGGRTR